MRPVIVPLDTCACDTAAIGKDSTSRNSTIRAIGLERQRFQADGRKMEVGEEIDACEIICDFPSFIKVCAMVGGIITNCQFKSFTFTYVCLFFHTGSGAQKFRSP